MALQAQLKLVWDFVICLWKCTHVALNITLSTRPREKFVRPRRIHNNGSNLIFTDVKPGGVLTRCPDLPPSEKEI